MSDIEVDRRGEVEWIRLNRPERMNAYDADMAKSLIAAVENAADAGVIVGGMTMIRNPKYLYPSEGKSPTRGMQRA